MPETNTWLGHVPYGSGHRWKHFVDMSKVAVYVD